MFRKTFSVAMILLFVSVIMPRESDANWRELAGMAWRKATEWVSSPSGQRTVRNIVEKPGTEPKVNKVKEVVIDIGYGIANFHNLMICAECRAARARGDDWGYSRH